MNEGTERGDAAGDRAGDEPTTSRRWPSSTRPRAPRRRRADTEDDVARRRRARLATTAPADAATAVVAGAGRPAHRAPPGALGPGAVADRARRPGRRHDADARRHDRRDDERRPPQPAQPGRRPDLRPHHADRRRHGRPRVGSGVPARPPAVRTSSSPAGAWTGTPACRSYRFYMVVPALAIVALDVAPARTAWRSSSSPSPGSSPCRSAAGRSAGWPASATRCRSCSPSPACASRSTRASASTAAT